jgi:Na+-translocating ferredoxin:NAD+ oxidoreductase RNF subunit RnfB
MAITLPLLFLGILGLIFGAALGALSRTSYAHADANIKKIILALPNVDCGACGYATCADFARAVAEGKAEATGCIPGGAKSAHEIADILGIAITPLDPVMAVVHCKGGDKEAAHRCVYDGIKDCHAAILAGNGHKTCADSCLGLESCVTACPFDAIHVSGNGVAVVDPDACTGCGLCVRACPRSVIDLIPRVHKIYLSCVNHDRGTRVKKYCAVGCTACTLCVKATPSGAITMGNNLPVLDYSLGENFVVAAHTCPSNCFVDLVKFRPKVNIDANCTGCGDCVPSCPTDAIAGEKGRRHVVNKEKCIGCGLCLNTCPVHAIAMWGGLGYVEDSRRRVMRV